MYIYIDLSMYNAHKMEILNDFNSALYLLCVAWVLTCIIEAFLISNPYKSVNVVISSISNPYRGLECYDKISAVLALRAKLGQRPRRDMCTRFHFHHFVLILANACNTE